MPDPIESRKDKPPILTEPVNWKDMVKKYEEREAEQKVEVSTEEALNIIRAKESRYAKERETVRDKSVIKDPQDHEIQHLRETLKEEDEATRKIFESRLPEFSGKEAARTLKGRVTGQSEIK